MRLLRRRCYMSVPFILSKPKEANIPDRMVARMSIRNCVENFFSITGLSTPLDEREYHVF